MSKLTEVVDGERRFVDRAPLLVRLSDLVEADDVDRAMADADRVLQGDAATSPKERQVLLSRFRFVDVARKVVGVGSVGTRDWVMLLVGRDEDDPLILQFKEAQASVLEPYLGPSDFAQHGRRVDVGQGPRPIDAYLGNSDTFERSMLAFAESYAVQSAQDVELLRQAIAAGTVVAESGI